MKRTCPKRRPGWLLIATVGLALVPAASTATAQVAGLQDPPAPTDGNTGLRIIPPDPIDRADAAFEAVPAPAGGVDFWPDLGGAALTWFAVVVILVLTFRVKPLLSERNLDGLILAATCLLLALRADTGVLPRWAGGLTGQWWSYLLLSVAPGYWLLRGLRCMLARTVVRGESTVSSGALFVLVLAGLAVGIGRISTEPLSAGARDGLAGGLCTAQTGKLPYGDAGSHDCRSPLLYLLNVGVVQMLSPTTVLNEADEPLTMSWENRAHWLDQPWWQAGDFAPARLVNGLLFVLLLLALYVLGRRLHSAEIGLTMMAVLCVFPGAVECFGRPDVMLPTTLMAWSVVAALVPVVGGLLAGLLLVLAGVASPWAWLGLPVLLAYMFRNGLQSLGAVVGSLGAVAAILAGLTWLTMPTIPRAAGALQRADLPPDYVIGRSEHGILKVEPRAAEEPRARGWLRVCWKFLVDSESLVLDVAATGRGQSKVYTGEIDPRRLVYRRLAPTAAAQVELTQRYRAALADEPAVTRMWVALRTVLEQTWLAAVPAAEDASGAWALWGRSAPGEQSHTPLVRKLMKLLVGLVSIAVGVLIYLRGQVRPHQLIGGLLLVYSATLLVSSLGAVANLVWLLPLVLALWATNHEPPAAKPQVETPEDPPAVDSPFPGGPAPRITVQ